MRVKVTNKLSDIIAVNQRSETAQTSIDIIELSSLNDIILSAEAERIRESMRDRGVRVRQLTNLQTIEPWTAVDGFIKNCMEIRHLSEKVLPIKTEVLIFDNIVAFYRVIPEVTVIITEDMAFADQQRALFDQVWRISRPVQLKPDGSTV